jgi:guanylate kinase
VEELERRLSGRGDSAEGVARRMRDAVAEMSHYDEYDYLVVNDDFEQAVAALVAIVLAERHRLGPQRVRHASLLDRLVAP